ncbi:MAG: hypothetical protein ACK4F5_07100 [Aliihoeflea sp.]
MIKFAAAAIWIIVVTAGTVLFAYQSGDDQAEVDVEATLFAGLEYVKTDVISVPVIKDNAVYGYFLARLVYTAEAKRLNQMVMPPEAIIHDEVYTHLFANPQIDFTRRDTLDLDAFRNGIRESVNQRVGEPLIRDVLIEQMDFLSKADIRDSMMRGVVANDL